MRLLFSTLVLTIVSWNCIAQTDTLVSKNVYNKFLLYYNQNKIDSIYTMLSAGKKENITLNAAKEYLADLKKQAGNIVTSELLNYQAESFSYKTQFEKQMLKVWLSVDSNNLIQDISINPFEPDTLPKLSRNITKMILPFKEEWTIFEGGDTKELNHHIGSKSQSGAIDFAVTDSNGKPYKTDGNTNEDHYSFGKEIIAPCAGEVVLVIDGVKDNRPDVINNAFYTGNTIVIKTKNNEYLLFAHLKQHSIVVKEGQTVKQSQLLGQCGNSGKSNGPHLHFHIQNDEDINIATGAKCYFEKIVVNGQNKFDYSPISGEKVKN